MNISKTKTIGLINGNKYPSKLNKLNTAINKKNAYPTPHAKLTFIYTYNFFSRIVNTPSIKSKS